MMLWKVLLAGVALLTVEDVLAGIPKQATNTVPSVEPTGTGASTPVPKPNPSAGPIGTDVPTPLSNLNPSSGPLGTGAPTPVPTGPTGTDVPTPISILNPSSRPQGTGAPTPVATGPIGTNGSTVVSNLNPTGAPMTSINPSAGSTATNGPTPISSLKPSAGPSAELSTGTTSQVTNVISGHTGTGTKTSVRPTPKSTSISEIKTSPETMAISSHISSAGSSLQSTVHSLVTSVRPSIAVQSPTGESSTASTTKVTSVRPSIAVQSSTVGSSTVSTTKVTSVRPSIAVQSSTGKSSTVSTTKITSVRPSIAVQSSTGGSSTASTTEVTSVRPSIAVQSSIVGSSTASTTKVTSVRPSTAVQSSTVGSSTASTTKVTSVRPSIAVQSSIVGSSTASTTKVTSVRPSIAVQSSTVGSSTASTTKVTSVRPSFAVQSSTGGSSTASTTKVTSVRPSIAVQSSTVGSSTASTTKVTVEASTARKLPTTSEDVKVSTAAPTSAKSTTTLKMQATTPQTTKSQTTNKPVSISRENKTECFEYLGCFDNFPPFDNAGLDLPYSPDVINTKFWLFTRKNLKNKHVLDYKNISTFTSFDFDATKPTKFITHGFSQEASATWVVEMKDEFLKLGDFNVITVDWKKGAEFPNYDQAAANTRLVATQIRVVVDILVSRGLKLHDLHLAGHSLGAHTSGYAGFLLKGKVGRISGMDPAEPSFENLPDVVRLDKADALFVDVIHTNGESVILGGFGLMESSGHVDFFVNGGKSQPGCKGALSGALSSIFGKGGSIGEEVACSHGRSHQLYLESMSVPCPFTSYPCPSYDDFKKGKCLTCGSTGCSQLGYYADQYYARGKMYLNTGSKTPYCGYHYGVKIKTSSTKDTKGRLYVKMEGTWGTSDFVPVTGDDAVKAGSEVQDVIVSPVEVGDLKSLVFKYVKHTGFWLGGGEDTLKVDRVKVTSGENGDSYLFCYGGKEVHHNTEARTTITSRTTC